MIIDIKKVFEQTEKYKKKYIKSLKNNITMCNIILKNESKLEVKVIKKAISEKKRATRIIKEHKELDKMLEGIVKNLKD